jgi:hypothetical protein
MSREGKTMTKDEEIRSALPGIGHQPDDDIADAVEAVDAARYGEPASPWRTGHPTAEEVAAHAEAHPVELSNRERLDLPAVGLWMVLPHPGRVSVPTTVLLGVLATGEVHGEHPNGFLFTLDAFTAESQWKCLDACGDDLDANERPLTFAQEWGLAMREHRFTDAHRALDCLYTALGFGDMHTRTADRPFTLSTVRSGKDDGFWISTVTRVGETEALAVARATDGEGAECEAKVHALIAALRGGHPLPTWVEALFARAK